MDYKKKIKMRIFTNIIYVFFGIVFIAADCIFFLSEKNVLTSLGIAYIVCGLIHTIRNIKLLFNPELFNKLRIAETDERNLMLLDKARSMAFAVYIITASVFIVVFYMLKMNTAAQIAAYSVCFNAVSFWVCYHILKRKY